MNKPKIIISHDVDHLYAMDHIKDLIIPKLIVRSLIQLLKKQISFNCFCNRFARCLPGKRWNRIPEIVEYDRYNDIPSTFFFGMANGLGMSYSPQKAKKWIQFLIDKGFQVGVHGVNYTDLKEMEKEKKLFEKISGLKEFGIRTHYVRYDQDTFVKLAKIGYLFDTSQFCKSEIKLSIPYRIDNMWEFPLHIMDGYTCRPGKLEKAKNDFIKAIEETCQKELKYLTILFHDYQFDSNVYPEEKCFYEWVVQYCKINKYSFIDYKDAISELNNPIPR